MLQATARLASDDRVVAVYGFGSRFHGGSGPRSDVDIAVLLRQEPLTLRDELRLRAEIVEQLQRDDIDLVVLNGAPPLLRYEVVAGGRRLFARDEITADHFEEAAYRDYFDTAYLRRVQRELQREAAG